MFLRHLALGAAVLAASTHAGLLQRALVTQGQPIDDKGRGAPLLGM